MDFFKLISQKIIDVWSFLEPTIDLAFLLVSHQENWFQDNKSYINYDDGDIIAMAIMIMILGIMVIMITIIVKVKIMKSMMIKMIMMSILMITI